MGEVTPLSKSRAGGLTPPAPISTSHDLSSFDCGQLALNDWLKTRAMKSEGRFARTYVVCAGPSVVGYFCTSAGTVERAQAPGKLRRNAPEPIPVSIIGRLAVCQSHARQGLGQDLLADALRRIASASEVIGIAAVLVHAKDENARRFYLRCAEFLEYPAESRTLFLPIETIIAAL